MGAEPKPSATVALVRDADEGLEILLLRRSPRRDGTAGPWVFPGGKVEAADRVDLAEDAERCAHR